MALVSYDYDSNSENEEDDIIEKSSRVLVTNNITNTKADIEDEIKVSAEEVKLQNKEIASQNNLFSSLPQTKTNINNKIVEDQIEDFIPKSKEIKEKQKVKITIPSLSQFIDVDDDEPQIKRQKPSAKGSSLISILPPVKGTITTTKTFVPNVVANKNKNNNLGTTNSTISTTSLIPHVLRKKAEAKKSALLQKIQQKKESKLGGSDIESDDDIDMPETFDDEMWQKVCGRPKPKQIIQEPEETPPQEIIDIAPEPEKPYDGLDNKAFKELVGKSKRPIGNIKLIDINEEEILPDKDLWMTKSLTDPEMAPKPEIEDPVDPTRRKKHHITYLAQQAKANEQELQNAWSASKNNRMATRAKYGF